MKAPVVDVLGGAGHRRTGRIVPVYPTVAGITSWRLEQFLNGLSGEVVAVIPNVTQYFMMYGAKVDYVIVVERV